MGGLQEADLAELRSYKEPHVLVRLVGLGLLLLLEPPPLLAPAGAVGPAPTGPSFSAALGPAGSASGVAPGGGLDWRSVQRLLGETHPKLIDRCREFDPVKQASPAGPDVPSAPGVAGNAVHL